MTRIQAVTADDIQRVMRAALDSQPAFAAVGDVTALPNTGALSMYFDHKLRGSAMSSSTQRRRASAPQPWVSGAAPPHFVHAGGLAGVTAGIRAAAAAVTSSTAAGAPAATPPVYKH